VLLSHTFVYRDNLIVDDIVCIFLASGSWSSFSLMAGKVGLIVITLERYFKIVHAIAHRKYYRDWMLKVAVALPWIGGACLAMFPAIGTTRVVNGRCLSFAVWPTASMSEVQIE